jgi:hypothetical protein
VPESLRALIGNACERCFFPVPAPAGGDLTIQVEEQRVLALTLDLPFRFEP